MEKVVWKGFNEYATYTRGIIYNKKQEAENEENAVAVLRANNITLSNTINLDDLKFVNDEVKIRDDQWLKKNDILICAGSGSKEHVGKVAFVENDTEFTFGGFMAVIRAKEGVNSRYLYHNFVSSAFRDYLVTALNSTTINNLNLQVISGFEIPLPAGSAAESLSVQSEIVERLDACTSLIESLKAELMLRKKQYAHYREKLLDFKEGEVEWKHTTLGEIAPYSKRRISCDAVDDSNYISVDNLLQNKAGKTRAYSVPSSGNLTRFDEGDILVGNIRPYLKKIWFADCTGGTNGDVLVFSINNEEIEPRFLYYIISADTFFDYSNQFARGGGMPRGDKKAILKYPIAYPIDKSVQHQIVSCLDTFEGLIETLSQEIALREKQYEYMREGLLGT